MKKILLAWCALVLLVGCNRTPEEKVARLVEDAITQSRNYPRSYEMTGLELDSVSAVIMNSELHGVLNKICQLEDEMNQLQLDTTEATQTRLRNFEDQMVELEQKMCLVLTESTGESGYLAKVKYKAKDNFGETKAYEVYATLNKNLDKIKGLHETAYFDRIMNCLRDKIVEITEREQILPQQ